MKYFAGNSLAAFYRTTTGVIESTVGGTYNTSFCQNSLRGGASTDYFAAKAPFNGNASISGTMYLRYDYYMQNNQIEILFLSGGQNAYRLTTAGSAIAVMQYWNTVTGAWVNWGTSFAISGGLLQTHCLKMQVNNNWTLYVGGTAVASNATVPTNGVASFDEVRFFGSLAYYSQIMCADYDLRDAHLMQATLNGNSATNTAGTGAYTDVNEVSLDESTAIVLSAAGKKGQTHAAITVPTGLGIAALVLAARGRAVSDGGITDGKLGVRSGGNNYSSTARGYTSGFEPRTHMLEADPATGVGWTQTGFNNAETYLEAA